MKSTISHIAVYVKDIEKAREYYVRYFGGLSNNLYQNSEGFSSYFISFSGEVSLELMHHTSLEEGQVIDRITGYSHIAFSVGSEEGVKTLTREISDAGYAIYSGPRKTGDGYFESCVADPDGNRVEITV